MPIFYPYNGQMLKNGNNFVPPDVLCIGWQKKDQCCIRNRSASSVCMCRFYIMVLFAETSNNNSEKGRTRNRKWGARACEKLTFCDERARTNYLYRFFLFFSFSDHTTKNPHTHTRLCSSHFTPSYAPPHTWWCRSAPVEFYPRCVFTLYQFTPQTQEDYTHRHFNY
jgi:hypothetical protein